MHRVTALELRPEAMPPMPDDSRGNGNRWTGLSRWRLPPAPTLDLEAVAVTVDLGPDTVLVKYEYVVVDAEKQTTRAVISTTPWEW